MDESQKDKDQKDKEWWKREAAEQEEFWRRRVAGQAEEFIRQNNLMYGGLIAIGVVMIQPFLTAGAEALDLAGKICVVAFSVAIPLLAALILLNRQETFRRREATSLVVQGARVAGLASGFAGVVAGFWHILQIAGVVMLVCGILGMFVHSAGWAKVELADAQAVQEGEEDAE